MPAAGDGLAVDRAREAGALDGADQVLAEAQVVQLEVDLEEVVDHVERAPLLRDAQLGAVGHRDLERLVQDARRRLELLAL